MYIQLDDSNVSISSEEKRFLRQHAEAMFSRMRHIIHRISVTVSDENGPDGGSDTSCKVVIKGKDGSQVIIRDVRSEALTAITSALHRANYAFIRNLKRKQLLRRRGVPTVRLLDMGSPQSTSEYKKTALPDDVLGGDAANDISDDQNNDDSLQYLPPNK